MTAQRAEKTLPRPEPELLPAVIESLLFVAEEPQEIATLAKSLNVTKERIEKAVQVLIESNDGRGVLVQRLGDRVQLATAPQAAPYIERFLEVEYGRLSRAALETLAIIVYRAPVTRAMIESIRGVNSDHAVATLLSRGLIEEVGRAPGPGRPILLSPAVRFLEYFGLQHTGELPPLPALEGEEAVAEPAASSNGHEPQAEDGAPEEPEAFEQEPGDVVAEAVGHEGEGERDE